MKSIWIVQPYVPKYRVLFFESLAESLDASNIRMRVVASEPDAKQAARGDGSRPPWLQTIRRVEMKALNKSINVKSAFRHWRHADGVIAPHMGTSPDAMLATIRRTVGSRTRVGLWGHIDSYVAPANSIDRAVERWQLRHADHIFAYTAGGARYAASVTRERVAITTVMNSLDTSLIDYQRSLAGAPRSHSLHRLVFVGGLDESKRVDILAGALDELHKRRVSVTVRVAGSGRAASLLEDAVRRGQVVLEGYLDGAQKAELIANSSAILCPGRIGLVAVEALAAGVPIISTPYPYHAPEREYLEEGMSLVSSESMSAPAYADAILRGTSMPIALPQGLHPTLAQMVNNFAAGVEEMLAPSNERKA